jgi:hypothetical protein
VEISANLEEGAGRRSARHEQGEQAQRAIEHEKKSEKNGPPPRRPVGDNKGQTEKRGPAPSIESRHPVAHASIVPGRALSSCEETRTDLRVNENIVNLAVGIVHRTPADGGL